MLVFGRRQLLAPASVFPPRVAIISINIQYFPLALQVAYLLYLSYSHSLSVHPFLTFFLLSSILRSKNYFILSFNLSLCLSRSPFCHTAMTLTTSWDLP